MSDGPLDFGNLLRDYAAGQESAAAASAPDPAVEVLQLASKVRRRRLARSGTIAAIGAAAALVGVVAVYGVTRPDPVPPAPQPTETATVEPTPDATETNEPDAGPTAAPVETASVTRHDLLPQVEPMRDDLWEQTDDEWILGRYSASKENPDGSFVRSPDVLYLLAPDGTTYEVELRGLPLPEGAPAPRWYLTEWMPGDSRAVFVGAFDEDNPGEDISVVVDLRTGEELVRYSSWEDIVVLLPQDRTLVIRQNDAGLKVAQVHDRDGYHLHEIGPFEMAEGSAGHVWSRGWAVDPSRTQLLLQTTSGISAFDLDQMRELAIPVLPAPAQQPCRALGWLEHDRFVLSCDEMEDLGDGIQGLGAHLWIANFGDGSSRRITELHQPDGSQVTEVRQIGDTLVADRSGSTCDPELAVVEADGTQRVVGGVEALDIIGVRAGQLVAETWACDGTATGVVSIDVATGRVSLLVPRVEGAWVDFLAPSGLGQMSRTFGMW